MSESPREPERDEAASSRSATETSTHDSADDPRRAGTDPPAASAAGADRADPPRRRWTFGPATGKPLDERQRRRRRFFVAGIVVAAVVLVIALCAGLLSVVSAVDHVRDRAGDAHESRLLRDHDCLQLEQRLNRLNPPGATTGPPARATAVRNENAAVRIYLDVLDDQRDEDAWRQLLDARTVYADALDRQAQSRTPAFYVPPRTGAGLAVTEELERRSPAPCAGPVRRLAAPDL
ncbi:hypothetical protein ACWKSP_09590 [Micromonosporaceae bacterium Da 78-11]